MTAVEWLEVQMFNLQIELNKEKISITKYEWIRLEIINQAKEMEMEQIENSFYHGVELTKIRVESIIDDADFEDYYNETFKSE
jgi:hypothetical protein